MGTNEYISSLFFAKIPADLILIYQKIVERFLGRVEFEDSQEWRKNNAKSYYNKWISTVHLANDFGVSATQMRTKLNKLEKLGIISSCRRPNHITWAANYIEGFEQHQYADYYCRINKK